MNFTIDEDSFKSVSEFLGRVNTFANSPLYCYHLMKDMARMCDKPGYTCGTLGFILIATSYGKIIAAVDGNYSDLNKLELVTE